MNAACNSPADAASIPSPLALLWDLPGGAIQAVQTDNCRLIADYVGRYSQTPGHRRLVYLPLSSAGTLRDAIDNLIEGLNGLVEASWPHWFGDVDFGWFRDDPLGNERLRDLVRQLVMRSDRVCPGWTTAAVRLAANDLSVRGASIESTIQATQSSLALSPSGMILFLPVAGNFDPDRVSVTVALVEWAARYTESVVVPIIPTHWPNVHPLDRLLFNPWLIDETNNTNISSEFQYRDSTEGIGQPAARSTPQISAISGLPHPLSDVEKRVWAYLSRDPELGAIFRCNQTVATLRGHRPRVDLLWPEGAVVVELDGYPDHSARDAFERDRHRDYELLMSGYQVLRITNDEVTRDLEAAVGKIRDVVNWRKQMLKGQKRS